MLHTRALASKVGHQSFSCENTRGSCRHLLSRIIKADKMSDGYNFKKLKSEILKLSKARDWEIAKKEWALHSIYESDEFERCLCGHSPIKEICCLFNRITEKHADVGNVCVKKFLGIRSDLIFSALKRVRKDISKSLNADSITFFFRK